MEHYPLILDGVEAGSVSVHSEGGWTVFDAQCGDVQGVVRISVYGAGREGYLGVLTPEDGRFALHRRMSRAALRDFPAPIEYAGRAGQPAAAPTPEEAPPEPAEETAPEAPECKRAEAEAAPEPPQNAPPAPEPPQEQSETPPALEDVYWYASPDGALVCFDGEQNLIALPAGDGRIPDGPGGWPRTIEGRDYVVFRTRDGRLLR